MEIRSIMPQDREHSASARAITALARRLMRKDAASSQATLSLAFVLPGIDDQLPFQGMRLTAHDEITKTLTIEAAVPLPMLDPPKAAPYVLAVAADAIDAASEFFAETGTPFDARGLHAIVAAISPGELEHPAREHFAPDPSHGN
jgi:hypothetical protein